MDCQVQVHGKFWCHPSYMALRCSTVWSCRPALVMIKVMQVFCLNYWTRQQVDVLSACIPSCLFIPECAQIPSAVLMNSSRFDCDKVGLEYV